MPQESREFGRELRRMRMAAGLSLQQLGQRVHYSKSQLSKVERGLKRPTPELARLCDTVLDARSALTRLVPVPRSQPQLPAPENDDEVWLMQLRKDGSSSFQPMKRRDVIAAGAASVLTMSSGAPQILSPVPGGAETLVEASRMLFDQFRRLGQVSGPASVLPPLIAQTHSLEQFAVASAPRARRDLLLLASRYAEYAGWMAQECGDDKAAIWWTERAVQLAAAGKDTGLAAYAQVRRSLISLYRGDADDAAQLAGHALRSDAPSRIRGLAAQHLAQARAVEGDYDACMRSLDQARDLLERDSADPSQPVLGASHVPDVVSMFTGWCLYDLGRPRDAAVLLDTETARVPAHAFRTRARYGVRRALAHAAAGDVEHACAITAEVLPSVRLTHSSTIRADLRRLSRTLGRHAGHRSVRALVPDLTDVLSSTS
ncbi:helix-turn-helix domain-containing protein [Streptomyces sp. NPDC094437]|uniref:helix-turn-helix domain-containing protein n=1 Tax=Streptomyces sp. NPDC094437 TaxID=3366060 RepID=UPI00380D87EE